MHENMKVCIHCGGREHLFHVGITRGDVQVGIVYFCKDCRGVLEKSSIEIFLNREEEEREAGGMVH